MTYSRASFGCSVHSLILSVSLWLAFVCGRGFSDLAQWLMGTIWVVLLVAWPAWGFILWKAAEGKIRRWLHALIVGFLFLCPTFLLLFVIYALRNAKHI